jgi:hypothetical protein
VIRAACAFRGDAIVNLTQNLFNLQVFFHHDFVCSPPGTANISVVSTGAERSEA